MSDLPAGMEKRASSPCAPACPGLYGSSCSTGSAVRQSPPCLRCLAAPEWNGKERMSCQARMWPFPLLPLTAPLDGKRSRDEWARKDQRKSCLSGRPRWPPLVLCRCASRKKRRIHSPTRCRWSGCRTRNEKEIPACRNRRPVLTPAYCRSFPLWCARKKRDEEPRQACAEKNPCPFLTRACRHHLKKKGAAGS